MHIKPRLLTPGPTPLPEEVRLALAQDMVHHRKTDFKKIMAEVQEGLGLLFATEQPVLPLSCSGTGAMQAALSNLFQTGETVLVVEGGKFGQRWSNIASRLGLAVERLAVPWGQAVDPAAVSEKLDSNPSIAGILVQASETSTGVLHPVHQLGRLTKDSNTLLVVDGISAVGISPCPMDAWGIDCLLTGSQKGLMLPPGLALISLSQAAWDKARQVHNPNMYFDLLLELDKSRSQQTAYTSPVNLIFGLKACLDIFRRHGLEEIQDKYWRLTQMTRRGVEAIGLKLFVDRQYTWGLTSLELPQEIDAGKLLELAESEYRVTMAGGQDQLKGRLVRIGHMGYVDFADILAGLYALERGVTKLGGGPAARPDYLEQAMQAFEDPGYPEGDWKNKMERPFVAEDT